MTLLIVRSKTSNRRYLTAHFTGHGSRAAANAAAEAILRANPDRFVIEISAAK